MLQKLLRHGVQVTFSLMTIGIILSCSSIECQLNGKVTCHIAFQNEEGEDTTLAIPVSVVLSSSVTERDTTYIDSVSNASIIDIPLSYNADTDRMTLKLHTGNATLSDVVEIEKTNEPYFESVDCAARYNHVIQGVTHTDNFIKEVIVNNPKVRKDVAEANILVRIANSN